MSLIAKTSYWHRLIICLVLSLVSCWAYAADEGKRIKVEPLSKLLLSATRSAAGNVVAIRQSTVSAQLSSTIEDVLVLPGDMVQAGQTLATLDCTDFQLQTRQLRSQLDALDARKVLAGQQLNRLNRLQQSRNASEEQINQAQSELNVVTSEIQTQKIAIEIANTQTRKCSVTAPYSGLIHSITSHKGTFVNPGVPILEIIDIDSIELLVDLNLLQIREIEESSSQTFIFDDQSYPLVLRTLLPSINTVQQTQQARFTFPENKPAIGAAGRLQWPLPGQNLPDRLLVLRSGEYAIFILSQSAPDRVTFLPLKNAKPGKPARVNLPADTMVVTEGRFSLSDNDLVHVTLP